jgi:ethanolamine utilization cobalamin adenosyltransferase
LDIKRVSLLEYEGVKQYELRGRVSYDKDIESLIADIDKRIENLKNVKKAEEIAKKYISDILLDYEDDSSTELYKRLSEYSKESEEYDDDYFNDLINEKDELRLLLRFIGENGRLIWNIE